MKPMTVVGIACLAASMVAGTAQGATYTVTTAADLGEGVVARGDHARQHCRWDQPDRF